MKLPDGVRYFNKHFLNRLTAKIARASWGPFSIIYHVGRRTGKLYQTPIFVFPTADGFVAALTYGVEVDWYRNISAAGQCRVLWHRHEYNIDKIEPVEIGSALPLFPWFIRMGLQIMGTQHYLRFKYQPDKSS
jgi:deazaflavin-dependent oxidoreductase (nitroreductase family)